MDFYMELAGKLVDYSDNRDELLELVFPALEESGAPYKLTDTYADGTTGPLRDICPFTVLASFNRGISNANRMRIAEILKNVLDLSAAAPTGFDGIPVVSNFKSWFFAFEHLRKPGDIDALWQVFEATLKLADTETESMREAFITSYDAARTVEGVDINLSLGLFWIRPERFLSLDRHNKRYIREMFPNVWDHDDTPNGQEYLKLCDDLSSAMPAMVEGTLVRTFPGLSLAAWESRKTTASLVAEAEKDLEESGEYDFSSRPEARRKMAGAIALRRGQPKFRRQLLKAYGNRCAITGYNVEEALEACHIKTYPGQDMNRVSNGLLLRADIHTLFDHELIGIDPETGTVLIGHQLRGTEYAELEGRVAQLPDDPKLQPNAEALRQRCEEVKRRGR